MKKIILTAFMIVLFCNNVYCISEPSLKSKSAVLIDADSGRLLFGLNEAEPMPMASTTKIMTAIYAIEHGDLEDIVTVSKNAQGQPRVKMGLSGGERLKLKDLLYALMLESSNDAAVAIAEHIAGSEEQFCKLITDEARRIGAEDTVFETPNGLDRGDHHSTARDMAVIAAYALKNDIFREIIKTPSAQFSSDRRSYSFVNKDRLLNEYPGAIGVKTGYTGKAGHCFVGAAVRNGTTFISVVLASGWGAAGKEAKWSDTKKLLNYGFDNFSVKDIISAGDHAGNFLINNGDMPSAAAEYSESVKLPLKYDEKTEIKVDLNTVEAPVNKGDKVGSADILINGDVYRTIDIVASEYTDRHTFGYLLKKIAKKWTKMTY